MPLFKALAKNMAASYFGKKMVKTTLRFSRRSETSVCNMYVLCNPIVSTQKHFPFQSKFHVNDTCLLHVLLLHAYKQGALMTDSFRARCSNDRQFHFKEEKVNL